MNKKEQNPFGKRKRPTPNKKNAEKNSYHGRKNWLVGTKGHGLTMMFSEKKSREIKMALIFKVMIVIMVFIVVVMIGHM